jgi:nucleoid DNA-binding protein
MSKKSAAPAKPKAPTKSEVYANIADATGLPKRDVAAVFDALVGEIKKNMSGRGNGLFVIPGLLKVERRRVKARKAEKNWKNPFTGEIQERPARPGYNKVAVRALKALKEMVQ